MRAIAVLLVVGSVGVAHAEPARPVIGGAAVGVGAIDPGDNGYLPSALTGPYGSAYVGVPVGGDVALVVDGWLLKADEEHAAWAYGGDLGVQYTYARGASVTARAGLGHVEWSDSDGGYLDVSELAFGLAAGFEVLREPWGAIAITGAITRVLVDEVDDQMVYAASVGYAY